MIVTGKAPRGINDKQHSQILRFGCKMLTFSDNFIFLSSNFWIYQTAEERLFIPKNKFKNVENPLPSPNENYNKKVNWQH